MSDDFGPTGPQPVYTITPPPRGEDVRRRGCLLWVLVSLIVLGLFGLAFMVVAAAALGEGEDFELLFTISPGRVPALRRAWDRTSVV